MSHLPVGPVHHLRFTVTDVQRSIAFYTELLGFQVAVDAPPPPEDAGHDAIEESLQGGVILMHEGMFIGLRPVDQEPRGRSLRSAAGRARPHQLPGPDASRPRCRNQDPRRARCRARADPRVGAAGPVVPGVLRSRRHRPRAQRADLGSFLIAATRESIESLSRVMRRARSRRSASSQSWSTLSIRSAARGPLGIPCPAPVIGELDQPGPPAARVRCAAGQTLALERGELAADRRLIEVQLRAQLGGRARSDREPVEEHVDGTVHDRAAGSGPTDSLEATDEASELELDRLLSTGTVTHVPFPSDSIHMYDTCIWR